MTTLQRRTALFLVEYTARTVGAHSLPLKIYAITLKLRPLRLYKNGHQKPQHQIHRVAFFDTLSCSVHQARLCLLFINRKITSLVLQFYHENDKFSGGKRQNNAVSSGESALLHYQAAILTKWVQCQWVKPGDTLDSCGIIVENTHYICM